MHAAKQDIMGNSCRLSLHDTLTRSMKILPEFLEYTQPKVE
jgi:hypothetical protein